MKFSKAMKLLEGGAKVRRTTWDKNKYIYFGEDNILTNENGKVDTDWLSYRLNIYDEWEEYIEPQEPKECNHIWDNRLISAFSKEKGEIVKMKECRKCGKWEETADNTKEKIEELKKYDFYIYDSYSDGYEEEEFVGTTQAVETLKDKLNEVIRKINKEG